MITLKTVEWYDMFSYGKSNILDLQKNNITQLIGKNGHGKTSILHIIEEILFNKNSKGYKKAGILNRHSGSGSYGGTVIFEIDGVEYNVTAKRTGATQKVSLFKNGEDVSQHTATATYDLIEKLFKSDFKIISQIIGQNSKSSLQFLTTTDSLRKKFLIDLLNFESYLTEYEKVKDVHKVHADQLKLLEAELKHVSEWLSTNTKIDLTKKETIKEPEYPKDLENEIAAVSLQLATVDKTISAIRKNNQYLDLLANIPLDVLTEEIEKIDTSNYTTRKGILVSQIESTQKLISKIKSLHGKCHECLQDISDEFTNSKLEEQQVMRDKLTLQLADVVSLLKNAEVKNQRYALVKKYIDDFEKYSNLIDKSLPVVEPKAEELKEKLNTLTRAFTEAKNEISKIQKYNNEIVSHNAQVDLITSQIDQITEKQNKLKQQIEEKTTLVNHLEILKKTFSTNGLVAYKIENSVKDLENFTNTYLQDLSDGRFQLFFIINNDKLNVVIKDDGTDVDIEALSTGELSRVTTATLLAIRKLMATLSKSQINLLFLDETLDVLDDEGKEKLIDILVKETDLNTFLISHGYRHPLLQTVSVVKTNKISKLYDY